MSAALKTASAVSHCQILNIINNLFIRIHSLSGSVAALATGLQKACRSIGKYWHDTNVYSILLKIVCNLID